MAAIPWSKLHGATTHFPLVLSLVAFACDLAAAVLWGKPGARGLTHAALGAIVGAALGSVAAVVSGVYLTHGELWGTGALGMHHRFVWPAFALIVGAATWRWLSRSRLTRRSLAVYVVVALAGTALIFAAASFGGELLQAPA